MNYHELCWVKQLASLSKEFKSHWHLREVGQINTPVCVCVCSNKKALYQYSLKIPICLIFHKGCEVFLRNFLRAITKNSPKYKCLSFFSMTCSISQFDQVDTYDSHNSKH